MMCGNLFRCCTKILLNETFFLQKKYYFLIKSNTKPMRDTYGSKNKISKFRKTMGTDTTDNVISGVRRRTRSSI